MTAQTPEFVCPVCGFLSFDEPPGSHALCDVCDWEDDAIQLANPTSGGGANKESLVEAQAAVLRSHPLGVRELAGLRRADLWRPLAIAEVEQVERAVAANGHWPYRATSEYYWVIAPFGFETVLTMTDFYDGPRVGIAMYRGRVHFYQSLWRDEAQDWGEFELRPVDPETLALAIEDWHIWLRWELAFARGEASQKTHPALPADRPRHDEIAPMIEARLPPDTAPISACATFSAPTSTGLRVWHGLAAHWALAGDTVSG